MAFLKKLSVNGYRSIKQMELRLGKLNVLIGANGAGKSNFVSLFKMLNEMMAGRLEEHISKTGRATSTLHFGPKITPQMEAKFEFDVNGDSDEYHMRLFHAANDTLAFAEEVLDFTKQGRKGPNKLSLGVGHRETKIGDFAAQGDPIAKVFRYILNNCRVYHFHDTSSTARVRQYGYINDNRWLMHDAGNLAAMLYAYRQQSEQAYQRIVSTIRMVLPEFGDFDLTPDRLNPKDIALHYRKVGSDYLFGAHQISDGSLRAMATITLFLQPEADLPDVIVLDEPELGLHPLALDIIAGLIRAASIRSQVIIATQSQTLLNSFEPEEIITVESHQGQSHFKRLSANELTDWLDDYSIGELWQRNVLGGGPLP